MPKGRRTGYSPVTGWNGTLHKKTKAWSMPEEYWQWLESQPNQSEVLRSLFEILLNSDLSDTEAIADKIAHHRQQDKLTRREHLKDFLRNNPGWHDAYYIAEKIGSSAQNIQNLASQIKRSFPIETRKALGRGRRNEYRYKED